MAPEGHDQLEIAHVLFTDIVGYSLLPMDLQKDYLARFQQLVRDSPRVQAAESAGEIVSLPTGDGVALVFLRDPIAPVQCASEIARELRSLPHIKVRMGVNSGPVYRTSDINSHANVAGPGINMAQRTMDCGDAGHILVSESSAELLLQLTQWAPSLKDLGDVEVKHGVRMHLYNLVPEGAGNDAKPAKLAAARAQRRKLPAAVWAAVPLVLILAGWGWWRWNSGPVDEPSVAVLPFEDISPAKDQAYFGDGLAEELLNGLSRIPGLRVAARSSSFRFRDNRDDFREIRDKLQVRAVLQGSVRKQGTKARISVHLIKTSDGFELWTETFDKDLKDILAVQQEISASIVAKLKVAVQSGVVGAAPPRNSNVSAYDLYLKGLYQARKGTRESLEQAVTAYRSSLEADPSSARAWAALGSVLTDQAQHDYVPREDAYLQARQALDRASALDPTLASPYSTLAWISMNHDWNWDAASFYSQKALKLDPGSAVALNTAATLSMILNRHEDSIALYRRAIRIDPLSSAKLMNLGLVLYYAGRLDEADESLKKALAMAPDREDLHMNLALIRLAQRRYPEVLEEAGKEKNPSHRLFALALGQYAMGNAASAETLGRFIAAEGATSPCMVAEAFAYRGEKDRAFEWLGKAFDGRDPDLAEIRSIRLFAAIAGDPRFSMLVKKIGLPN